jgi:hypothetical protein
VVVGGAIEHAHEMLELKQETERLRLMRDLTKVSVDWFTMPGRRGS